MTAVITAALATIVLLVAMSLTRGLPGSQDGAELARRSDWSDEQYRRAVEEYRKDQQAGQRGGIQIALWAVFAGLAVWTAIQLGA